MLIIGLVPANSPENEVPNPTLRLTQGDRFVIKVGSTSVTTSDGGLDERSLESLSEQVAIARSDGLRPVLVSSGAVAAGLGADLPRSRLGDAWPETAADRQALAAIGQTRLMNTYQQLFARKGIEVAQVLLSARYFQSHKAYASVKRTLTRLLQLQALPIINGNDAVSAEGDLWFGENDRLAALATVMLKARLLVLLTDQTGLFSDDPRLNPDAELLEIVREIDDDVRNIARGTGDARGSGGMAAKIAAAEIVSWSGIPCVIAPAREPDVVRDIVRGDRIGTLIAPRVYEKTKRLLREREVYIAFAAPVRGQLFVDQGAIGALGGRKRRSLLVVGVRQVDGDFEAGDAVEIVAPDGSLVGKGLSSEASAVLRRAVIERAKGTVAVHADNLLFLRPDGIGPSALRGS